MRLLAPFLSTNSEISMDLIIDFKYWTGHQKLFEATVVDGGEEVDRRPGLMKVVFYEDEDVQYVHVLTKARKYTWPGGTGQFPSEQLLPRQLHHRQLPPRAIVPWTVPPGRFPPRAIARRHLPPPDNWPPDNSHLGKLPPDNWTWTISSYNKLTPGQITIEHLPPTTILIMVIASGRLRCLKNFYCLSFHLCHSKIHKHAFFQNIRQISPLE